MKISVIHNSYLPIKTFPHHKDFTIEGAAEYVYSNINRVMAFIDEAAKEGADLVCTHEDFTNAAGFGRNAHEIHEKLIDLTQTDLQRLLSEKAKEHKMLIAANHYEKHEGKVYNTSALYGRNGEVIGKYKKVHLAMSENWHGAAGDDYPVFETDIGNIGFTTCYDINFPEACRSLALNGADIVIHPTQGWGPGGGAFDDPAVGEAYMRVRAAENSVYFVVAKVLWADAGGADGGRSMVIDNFGRIIAERPTMDEGVLTVEIKDPNFNQKDEYDFCNFWAGLTEARARYLLSRRPETYGVITNPKPELFKRFPGAKLRIAPGDPEAIMREWEAVPEEEKKKFHW